MDEELLRQASAARERGDYAQALRLIDGLPSAAAKLERGRIRAALNDLAQARRDFNAASQADPAGPIGDLARGELLRSLAAIPSPNPPIHLPARRQIRGRGARSAPNPWAIKLVIALLVISILCAVTTILTQGYAPQFQWSTPTRQPPAAP